MEHAENTVPGHQTPGLNTLTAVPRSTQNFTFRGTVYEHKFSG